ncbi:class I SAM-dependent methyltransferase [Nonomuraea sp. NPDC050328]|uniref:class I SAM-dependent methyltransferase n=1 Tax=Nonomuraea sp. NPDC050328 TaxID=3364361 RepID=UPI0037A3C230
MRRSRGFDAPGPFLGLVLGTFVLVALAVAGFSTGAAPAGVAFLAGALYTALSAASYGYTMGWGRARVWAELLGPGGGESVLELGRRSLLVRAGSASGAAVGDLRDLPFADGSFEVVISSLALRDLRDAEGRARAVAEAFRVVRPGGRVLLAEVRGSEADEEVLRGLGGADVRRRNLGWRAWYGGPWFATWLVEARKPS